MYKKVTRLLALLLTFALIMTGIAVSPTQAAVASKTKVGDACYTILSENSATAEYVKPTKKTCTTATIPNTVKIGKKTYKVTSIAANAFKGCSKLKKVTIEKNVTKIGKKDFYGCKNLKTIKINTTKLTKKSVGSKAFAKINAKAVVTVPKNKLKAYKKILKKAGLKGKGQKVKGEKEEKHINDYDPSISQFEKEGGVTSFNFGSANEENSEWIDSAEYTVGDSMKISSRFTLLPPIYGYWIKDSRVINGRYLRCNACNRYFPSDFMLAKHMSYVLNLSGDNTCGGLGNYFIGTGSGYETWAFIADPDPCKMTIEYTLPQGVSCKKEDVSVSNYVEKIDLTKYCNIQVSGDKVVITIDDVKSEPFNVAFNTDAYLKDMYYCPPEREDGMSEGFRYATAVKLFPTINSDIGMDSDIRCAMTYTYKGTSCTENFSISLHTAAMQVANTDADGNALAGAEFELYRTKPVEQGSGSVGTVEWELLASGLHAGDVVKGLGMGFVSYENEYKLVQTKAPDGYQMAQPMEFAVNIDTSSGKTVITAADAWEDDELPVRDGVITVTVVNAGGETGNSSSSTPTEESSTDTVSKDTSSSSSNGIPIGGSAANDRDKASTVLVSYYKDGVRSFYAIYKEDKIGSDGMLDTATYVNSYANSFSDCKLEKLTINGESVASIPAKVPAGTEICYYYVTR